MLQNILDNLKERYETVNKRSVVNQIITASFDKRLESLVFRFQEAEMIDNTVVSICGHHAI